ncbi:MAG: redox-regulated ATPase YchF [Ignavibacteriae bacterium]|nr:redox-regulated ATPase YchF [Ignavibacteriota bacterium]
MQIAIVGLPYSGKTTFFQTLTETQLDQHTIQRHEANIATVKVQDKRLDEFTEIFQPKKKVNATIEIVDLVGVQKSEKAGSMFNTTFLTKVRTNDALIHVVRGFDDESVPHPEGSINVIRDIKLFEDEFLFADLAFVESRFEKIEREMGKQKSKEQALKEKEIMKKWNETLEKGIPLREREMHDEELLLAKNYQPLTAKPLLVAVNLDEKDISRAEEIAEAIRKDIKGKKIRIEPFFAKIEKELVTLEEEEKKMFMEEYGIKESALSRLIRSAYRLLGLQSFFTVGEDECRAWTIHEGDNAQVAAGTIHTDFFNKFIRAEVTHYEDFMKYKTFAKCKEHGVFRLEGKEYIVKDGDILHVRHG